MTYRNKRLFSIAILIRILLCYYTISFELAIAATDYAIAADDIYTSSECFGVCLATSP